MAQTPALGQMERKEIEGWKIPKDGIQEINPGLSGAKGWTSRRRRLIPL